MKPSEKTLHVLANLFAEWALAPKDIDIDTVNDPICQILAARVRFFDIKVPEQLGRVIGICSGYNPGISILMLYKILESAKNRRKAKLPCGYVITSDDFAHLFPAEWPTIYPSLVDEVIAGYRSFTPDKDLLKRWEEDWDRQKDEKGNNKVDSLDYWAEIIAYE